MIAAEKTTRVGPAGEVYLRTDEADVDRLLRTAIARHNEHLRSIDASSQSLTRWVSGDFLQAGEKMRNEILRRLAGVDALLGEVDRRARGGAEPEELREVEHGLTWLLDASAAEDCHHCRQAFYSTNEARAEVAELCPGHRALGALRRLAKLVIGGAA